MRAIKIVFGIGLFGVAAIGVYGSGGCSVNTNATDIICVPDQSDICTDCTKPDPSDKRTYRGRHTCSHDGRTFGSCLECQPVTSDSSDDITETKDPPTNPDGGPTAPDGTKIEAACANKLALLAGHDAVDDVFAYEAVFQDTGTFKVVSVSNSPMRSPAAVVVDGGTVTAIYRSRNDTLVETKLTAGLWSPMAVIPGALTDEAPAAMMWGDTLKAVFHQADGHYRIANYAAATGWAPALELVGSATAAAVTGGSPPTVAAVGAPGVTGSMIIDYADDAGGLYRHDWLAVNSLWTPKGIKSPTAGVGFRPAVITMTAGKDDLVSMYVTPDRVLHTSMRLSKDYGNTWSADGVVDPTANPMEAVNGVGLPGGRALVVYRAPDKTGWYTVFDPAKTPAWTAPAELVGGGKNPELASTPQVVQDTCGAEATVAYAEDGGGVALLRFANGVFTGPFVVNGITNVTYATVAAAP